MRFTETSKLRPSTSRGQEGLVSRDGKGKGKGKEPISRLLIPPSSREPIGSEDLEAGEKLK